MTEKAGRNPQLPTSETPRHKEQEQKEPWVKQAFVFIGPEGSGKSTQAERLSTRFGIPMLSPGDELKAIRLDSDRDDQLAQVIRKAHRNKKFVDGETVNEVLAERLGEEYFANGFVLDGAMRTADQTARFNRLLRISGRHTLPVVVVEFHAPRELSIQRMQERARPDDTAARIEARLQNYETNRDESRKIIEARKYNVIDVFVAESEAEKNATNTHEAEEAREETISSLHLHIVDSIINDWQNRQRSQSINVFSSMLLY